MKSIKGPSLEVIICSSWQDCRGSMGLNSGQLHPESNPKVSPKLETGVKDQQSWDILYIALKALKG